MSLQNQNNNDSCKIKILAACSGGGHLEQMGIISAAFKGHDVVYVTTRPDQARTIGFEKVISVPDCNAKRVSAVIGCLIKVFSILRKNKPHLVISTGAAPGLLCVGLAKIQGIRAIWIDSIANAEKLSLSGRISLLIGVETYSQWEHVSQKYKIDYLGRVL